MGYPVNKIRESIQRTGFSTELKTVQELLKQNWQTVHSTTYVDLDEGKSREIDALAVRRRTNAEPYYSFGFHLVVEVKHSDNPWICFSSKPSYSRSPWSIVHATNTRSPYSKARNHDWLPMFSGHCALDDYLRSDRILIGRAFHEIVNNDTDKRVGQDQGVKNRPLAGLRQVTKAARFFADQLQEERDLSVSRPIYSPSIDVFHPVLVVDHELHEVHLDDTGAEVIEQQDWIPVEMTYSSPTTRKGIWGDSYFPDIVTLAAFPDYLLAVERWRQKMIEKMDEELSDQRYGSSWKPSGVPRSTPALPQPPRT